MLVVTCDNCCNLSRFCQELTGLLSYRKVEPNGLILFCLAGLSEPVSEREEEVFLFSRALISYRQNPERCLALLASFSLFFQLIQANPLDAEGLSTLFTRAVIHEGRVDQAGQPSIARRIVGATAQVTVCCRGPARWEGIG